MYVHMSFVFRTVTQLLEQSIQYGEGNSLLLIGPRGVGKSWVSLELQSPILLVI